MAALSFTLYLLLFAIFIGVWRLSTRTWSVVTPFFIFGVFEIVSVWPATLYAAMSGTSSTGYYPVVVAGLAFIAFILGFVFVLASTSYSAAEPGSFRDRSILQPTSDTPYLLTIVIVAACLTGLGLYLYQGLPPVVTALVELGRGSGSLDTAIDIVAAGREEVTKGHYLGEAYRGQGLILELMQDGWPYLLGLAVILFIVTRRARWLVVSGVLLVLTLFFVAGSGQRWQALLTLLVLGITLSLVARPRAVWMIAAGLAVLGLYLGMSVLNSNYQGIGNTANPTEEFIATAASRVTLANGLHDVESINFVEDGTLDLGYGSVHVQKFWTSIPGVGKDEVPFSAKLAVLLDPSRPETDSTYASSTYLGWLYVDFGLPGVLLVFLAIGGVLAWTQARVFSGPKRLIDLPARGWVIYYVAELALDGPPTMLASLLIVGMVYLAARACVAVLANPLMETSGAPIVMYDHARRFG